MADGPERENSRMLEGEIKREAEMEIKRVSILKVLLIVNKTYMVKKIARWTLFWNPLNER